MEEAVDHAWGLFKASLGPAMGVSLVLMLLVRLLGGQRFAPLATLLAVAGGLFAGGIGTVEVDTSEGGMEWQWKERDVIPWNLAPDRPFDAQEIVQVLGWYLERKPEPRPRDGDGEENADDTEEEGPPWPNPARYRAYFWSGYLIGLAMIVEFLIALLAIPAGPGWAARTIVAMLAARLLTPDGVRTEHFWVPSALGLVILLEWAVLTSLARRWRDGTIPTSLGLCCVLAGILIFHAKYTSLMELTLLGGAALAGPALVAWKWPGDTSVAVAATVAFLPGFMVIASNQAKTTHPDLPLTSFVLAALAPLTLLPFTLPFLAKKERWTRWLLGVALPLIPLIIAVVLAALAEPGESAEW